MSSLQQAKAKNVATEPNSSSLNVSTDNSTSASEDWKGRGGRGRGGRGRGRSGRGRGGRGSRGGRGRGRSSGRGRGQAPGRYNSGDYSGRGRFYPTDNMTENENYQPRYPKRREFDKYKAEAIHLAKAAQDMELRPYSTLSGPFFSLDIECVAVGYGHTEQHRYPCRVALVGVPLNFDTNGTMDNTAENVMDEVDCLVDQIVSLKEIEVVSYLTELSGMTSEQCNVDSALPLDQVRELVQTKLPKNAILVGHSISHDIEWLGLVKGTDFDSFVDNSVIFRQRVPQNLGSAGNVLRRQIESRSAIDGTISPSHSEDVPEITSSPSLTDVEITNDSHLPFPTRYRTFGLRHSALNLLSVDMQTAAHNPVLDAHYSLLLFLKYYQKGTDNLRAVRDALHRSPVTRSFSMDNPLVEGVCLSIIGYRWKWAGRAIWRWWLKVKKNTKEE